MRKPFRDGLRAVRSAALSIGEKDVKSTEASETDHIRTACRNLSALSDA